MAKAAKTAAVAETRSYFLTYLVPTTFTDSEVNSIKETIAGLVTKHQGSITRTDDWGKRRMAYKIKHATKWHVEAVYVHLILELAPDKVQPLERDVHLNQNIMRHLLVLADGSEQQPEAV